MEPLDIATQNTRLDEKLGEIQRDIRKFFEEGRPTEYIKRKIVNWYIGVDFGKETLEQLVEEIASTEFKIDEPQFIVEVSEADRIEEEAWYILKKGNPFEYFIKTFSLDHEGDLTAARAIALSFASSSVANGDGLHVYLSGSSGRGKTHTAEVMFRQLPSEYNYNRSFSDRYLFYAGMDEKSGLKPGVVVLIDDQTMSEHVQELFKVSVSRFREGVTYGTVQSQKPLTLTMPSRISWVLLKVDDPGDDQVMNRLIKARIVETEEKIKDSANRIQKKYSALLKKTVTEERYEVKVCQSIWSKIKGDLVAVEVPCAGHVTFSDYNNLRNHEIFFNLIMAHAILQRWQREEIGNTPDGVPIIKATYEDYKESKLIFEALYSFGGQKNNTLKNEDGIIQALIIMNPVEGIFTIKEIAEKTGLSDQSCRRGLNGRRGKSGEILGGLLSKCPYIQKVGKRGRYQMDTDTEYTHRGDFQSREVTRKESYNEEIYHVDIDGLKDWNGQGEYIKVDPAFVWDTSAEFTTTT